MDEEVERLVDAEQRELKHQQEPIDGENAQCDRYCRRVKVGVAGFLLVLIAIILVFLGFLLIMEGRVAFGIQL